MGDTDARPDGQQAVDAVPSTVDEQAAAWFLRRRQRRLTTEENIALQEWLAASPRHAQAWRETEQTWQQFDDHATLPELVVAREEALASVRRTQLKRWSRPMPGQVHLERFRSPVRWLGAAAAAVILTSGVLWQTGVLGGSTYTTGVGEQRTVLLPDNSIVALDALTRIRVRYDDKARQVELVEGQAQFDVGSDVNRPFRVRAGNRTIEALGTSFTVAYIDRRMHVALLEGRVRVDSPADRSSGSIADGARNAKPSPSGATQPTPRHSVGTVLNPGDALHVDADGNQVVSAHADLAVATAWRQGKVIFQQEPLRSAVERLNRYSRVRLEVADPAIERWPVSGIFGVGDAEAFAEAIAAYFPIQAQRSDDVIALSKRK